MFAWADPIFDGLAAVLAWFYSLVPDYTFAICMLTLLIMLVFTPLTLRGARSMTKMQALQPEMAQLRKRHSGDRQKLNEEMMKLYQSHGVSPLGGCLPNLVQIPIFIVLYRVILNLRVTPDSPHFYNDPSNPDSYPRNLSEDTDLFADLVAAISDGFGEMRSLGMDLAQSAREVVQADFVDGLPYLALIAVTFLLAWLQQRQMARRRGNSAMPNRQMEIMMKYLPFMLPVFSFFVPAALVPYFIVSSIYRILQQAFIHARMKPAQPLAAGTSTDEVIEAETVPEPEPEPERHVPNQRSRKALDAEAARRVERERRSAERRAGSRNASSLPEPEATPPESAEPPPIRRTRSSGERVADARKSARRGARSSSRDQAGGRGRKRRRAEPAPETRPIQSRRTSGDGRTRNRRKR